MSLLLLSLLISIQVTYSTIYYVNPFNNNLYGGGKTWNNAFIDLNSAIIAANKLIDEIWLIGNYTYYPDATSDRTNCFIINKGVKLYGGFSGNETSINDRLTSSDPFFPYSIISGDIGIKNDKSDNCYHVIIYTETLSLNGVIIENGNANFNMNNDYSIQDKTVLHKYGAAIINSDIGGKNQLLLQNVIIRNNTALNGAGIFLFGKDKNIIIKDSKFENNKAIIIQSDDENTYIEGGYGGAIYVCYLANITVINTEFADNYAVSRGGGVYQVTSHPYFLILYLSFFYIFRIMEVFLNVMIVFLMEIMRDMEVLFLVKIVTVKHRARFHKLNHLYLQIIMLK